MSCSSSNTPTGAGSQPAWVEGRVPLPVVRGRPLLYASGMLPEDFPQRLDRLRRACNFTWNGFADVLGVDRKQVLRWKEDGTEPCGGAMLSVVRLAGVVPGGLDVIVEEGFLASLWRP